MVDKDVVLAKSAAIQKCLKRIIEVTGLDPGQLDDQDIQDIFVLNLQRAIQLEQFYTAIITHFDLVKKPSKK
jgi:hypothetical protein